jgi:RNA polymerase sigma factor (sigma-70 family)
VAAEDSDEQLMAAYASGDNAAFEELFRRHSPTILGMMKRHVRSTSEAHDLLQQTFLQLHRARQDFRAGALLRPWLYTIAMNCVREHYRRLGRRKEAPLGPAEEAKLTVEGDELEARQEEQLSRERLRSALAQLPANQREVIEMHWFQGRPFSEVAKMVGASISAVKVRAHRGYTRLREALADEETR